MYYHPTKNKLFNTHSEIRNAFKHIGFPEVIQESDLEYAEVYLVEATPAPNTTSTEVAVNGTPELVEGVWKQTWVVRPATQEEVDAKKPVVPATVTMRQARLALMKAGKLANVSAAIATLPSPQRETAEIEWEFSSEVFRNRELVLMIGAALQLDAKGLDDLFILAATL